MKGYIKIETTINEGKEGLSVKTHLNEVDYMDRVVVVHAVCNALKITPAELKMMANMIGYGLMDEVVDTNTLKDDDDEPQEAKKKKPNVHVVGLKSDGDVIVDLLKSILD